jgi:hypothetical protein
MDMAHDILTGDSPARLLLRWKNALRFRVGTGNSVRLDQLPNVEDFPDEFPTDNLTAGYSLGGVLGIATVKLLWPWPVEPIANVCTDALYALTDELEQGETTLDLSRLRVIGQVDQIATRAPHLVPVLAARLEALTNDDLHRMAMDAAQGWPVVPDVFEGLVE